MKNNNLNAIGVMSGTSLDGIDVSYISTDGKSSFHHKYSSIYKFRKSTRELINNLINDFSKNKKAIGRFIQCEKAVTEDYIDAIQKFIKLYNIKKIDLIALHGQTVFHSSSLKSSIQLCNGKFIAEKIKKIVVSDFRQKDLFNNGEGAPLVPIFHRLLINKFKLHKPCSFINIGGISNITFIDQRNKFIAYDMGPGMCLLDKYVFKKKKKLYDHYGKYSLKGNVNKKALKALRSDKFFKKSFPKSLDKNYFSFAPVSRLNFYDACATLATFTAYCIIDNVKKFKCKKIIISGGGAKNKFIMNLIKLNFKEKVISINLLHSDAKFIESQAFAYLGVRRLKNLSISFPGTTGVKRPITGGKID